MANRQFNKRQRNRKGDPERTIQKGQPRKDSPERATQKGQSIKDNSERTIQKGQSRKGNPERAIQKGQFRDIDNIGKQDTGLRQTRRMIKTNKTQD